MDKRRARAREMRRLLHGGGEQTRTLERLSYPCASACLGCGYLEPPGKNVDPMRNEHANGGVPVHPCPKCSRRAWIDLADVASSHAWVELERREIALRRSLRGAMSTTALSALVVAGLAIAGPPVILWVSFTALAVVFAVSGVTRIRDALSTPRRGSYRWHLPALRSSPGEVLASGPLDAEATAVSPITGRCGVGWRIEVRYPDDRAGEFALVEQSCPVALVVDDLATTEATLAITTALVSVDTPRARDWLRSRGLDPADTLEVSEAIVMAGDAVMLRRDLAGGPPVLTRP